MLVIIDMQNDYVDEKGKAIIPGAKYLVNGIFEKIKQYENNNDMIFYTINTIVPDDNRDKEELEWAITPYGKLKKALDKHKILKKTNYGISAETAIDFKNNIVKNIDIQTIEFVGVETNICVLANVIIFQNMFPKAKIIVNSKLCTSSNEILHSKALDLMNELKMEVI